MLIGASPPRPDGLAKVAGDTRYGDDLDIPGLWFGATLRSPHAHARVDRLGWRDGRAPAAALLLTAADLRAAGVVNGVQLIDDSWPILAEGVVRHVGEAVALVAAPSRARAREALGAIDVAYTPLAGVTDLDAALRRADAGDEQPLHSLGLSSGDVEPALNAAEIVVEGEYRTGLQEHIYIECQAMTAWFDAHGTVHAVGSMQCPYYVHKAFSHALGLPDEKIRIAASAVGGGFGGKEDYPSLIALHAALLARAVRHPVRIAYDRHEDIVGTTKRHPSIVRHRTGVDRDGRIVAMDIEMILDGGAYLTLSPVVLSRAILHATGPYRVPHARVRGRVLRTNTAPNGAFRGFGVPQAAFAIERHMDRVARRLGLDPYEIRARNVVEAGDRLPTGQVLDATTSARACLERAADRTRFRERWRESEGVRPHFDDPKWGPTPLRGIGLSVYFHGAGFTGSGELKMKSPVTARLLEDGRIEILTAMTDMGQGCAIVFPQIAAAAAGVSFDDIVFAPPDTSLVPDSGPTVASRTTMIVGGVIERAVRQLADIVRTTTLKGRSTVEDSETRRQPRQERASFRDLARGYLKTHGPLEVTLRHEPPAWQVFDDATYRGAAYPTYAWGCDVVEVDVDPDTYDVRPRRAVAVCEVGTAIHPILCRGQIEGGTLQAIGYATMEEIKLEQGRYLNDRLATYIIPTIKDCPVIDVELIERPFDGGPFGAKGVGELPMDGAAPAVVGAIENATGVSVDEIPATPERIVQALGARRWTNR
jgi:CO/xanthine dehydrogenase Mo-binding subunit